MANYTLVDKDGLGKKLDAMSNIQFNKICKDNLVTIFNRTRSMTPVSTEKTRPGGPHGELRLSASINIRDGLNSEVGYIKDYAPHVEYGHRTRDGGYVKGQGFLKKNVAIQQKIFPEDMRRAIENAK